jgi:hypothetical protein
LEAKLIQEFLEKHPQLQTAQLEVAKAEAKIQEYRNKVANDSPLLVKANGELEVAKRHLEKEKQDLLREATKKAKDIIAHKTEADTKATEAKLKVLRRQGEAITNQVKEIYDKADRVGRESFMIEHLRSELSELEGVVRKLRGEKEVLELQLGTGLLPTPAGLDLLQRDLIKELLDPKEKRGGTRLTASYLDRLLQYVKENPTRYDVPDAMQQIIAIYKSQGKTVEADAWRQKLLWEHPDSPAAKAVR